MGGVRLDLHVHSRHSPDSDLSVEAIVARLVSAGLNGFALTDHNSVAGLEELAHFQAQHSSLVLVPGVEVSTADGHLLAYGISEAPPPHRPVRETVAWVRDRGGLSSLAHPFRLSHGVGRSLAEGVDADAIESLNGHTAPRRNQKAAEVVVRRRLGVTAGSDAHELGDLGRVFTEFPEGTVDAVGVLRSIREGRASVGGRSPSFSEQFRIELRTLGLRLRRGLRPI